MDVMVYSTHRFEKEFLLNANNGKHNLKFLDVRLNETSADLAKGAKAVCLFVNDDASANVMEKLNQGGVAYIALRSAGYNNVNWKKQKI